MLGKKELEVNESDARTQKRCLVRTDGEQELKNRETGGEEVKRERRAGVEE